jgi:hypothetical protein
MTSSRIKHVFLVIIVTLLAPFVQAQKRVKAGNTLNIPMSTGQWVFEKGKVDFVDHKNLPAIKIKEMNGMAILKDLDFSNGIIEFDAEPLNATAAPFVTVYFRFQNKNESEVFYLRVGRQPSDSRNDAVQYAPVIKGVNIWDMLPHFQGPATLFDHKWNHIKLVVSGVQLRAYVNDMTKPVLEIPFLEGNTSRGTLAFEGVAAFANLVISPDVVEGLSPGKGVDLTDHDANYFRSWQVSRPSTLESGRVLSPADFPTDDSQWDSLRAERNGLIKITRRFGVENRRFVWIRTRITSAAELQRKIELGFSDEVWVFVNHQLVYVDKNLYLQQMRKTPNGRCSIQNASFNVNLKAGDNEILIGLANDFYGWGIIARLDNLEGLKIMR